MMATLTDENAHTPEPLEFWRCSIRGACRICPLHAYVQTQPPTSLKTPDNKALLQVLLSSMFSGRGGRPTDDGHNPA